MRGTMSQRWAGVWELVINLGRDDGRKWAVSGRD